MLTCVPCQMAVPSRGEDGVEERDVTEEVMRAGSSSSREVSLEQGESQPSIPAEPGKTLLAGLFFLSGGLTTATALGTFGITITSSLIERTRTHCSVVSCSHHLWSFGNIE